MLTYARVGGVGARGYYSAGGSHAVPSGGARAAAVQPPGGVAAYDARGEVLRYAHLTPQERTELDGLVATLEVLGLAVAMHEAMIDSPYVRDEWWRDELERAREWREQMYNVLADDGISRERAGAVKADASVQEMEAALAVLDEIIAGRREPHYCSPCPVRDSRAMIEMTRRRRLARDAGCEHPEHLFVGPLGLQAECPERQAARETAQRQREMDEKCENERRQRLAEAEQREEEQRERERQRQRAQTEQHEREAREAKEDREQRAARRPDRGQRSRKGWERRDERRRMHGYGYEPTPPPSPDRAEGGKARG